MGSVKDEAPLKKHFSSPLFIIPTRRITNGAENNNNSIDTVAPLRPSQSLVHVPFGRHNRSASIGTPRTPRE